MYAIAERHEQVGQLRSAENCRYWLDENGKQTPCPDMAAEYETLEDAEAAAELAGVTIDASSWWTIVDLENDDE